MTMNRRTHRPSLSDYDVDNFDDYETMQSGSWDKGAGSYRAQKTHLIDGSDGISCGGCWCGKPSGHSWPGDKDGAPHPPEEKK